MITFFAISMRRALTFIAVIATCAAISVPAQAQVTIGAPQTTSFGPFTRGAPGFSSFGQSFTSPLQSSTLTSVGLSLSNFNNGGALRFDVYIYLFDSAARRVASTALWSAIGVSGSSNDFAFDARTFDTGGLQLGGGATLLFFISAANQTGNPADAANLVGVSDADTYTGGSFFMASSGIYSDLLQPGAFTLVNGVADLAFSARFQLNAQVVPEPATALLLAVGLLAMLCIAARRRSVPRG